MKKLLLLIPLGIMPLLSGCASTVRELAHDNAEVDFHNVNPWTGTTDFHRRNPASTNSLPALPAQPVK